MEVAILVWIVCGVAAAFVAENRGASGLLWFFLSVVFGPLGLIRSFASGSDRVCPECRKRVHREATRCPYCQSDISTRTRYRCSECKRRTRKDPLRACNVASRSFLDAGPCGTDLQRQRCHSKKFGH